ncbi:MAG: phosphate ABC transporter substrate-binding protein [Oscillospiraceae bacterium]|nr:phosphate ABC transporter substrate-binding protein [Oscillospiraceae bacterium]
MKLKLGGSTSMSKLVSVLSEDFMEKNLGLKVEHSETGSGAAVNEVLNHTIDLGNISRNLNPDENPERFEKRIIAFDGIALVVNVKNPVENLSSSQIKSLFNGHVKNWSELLNFDAPVTVVGREESSGTRKGFQSAFSLGSEVSYNVEYPESGDIIARVGSDEGAIGYVSLASVSGKTKSVKVDDAACNRENIISGGYPVVRPFLQIFLKDFENVLFKKWFEFVNSEDGRTIINQENFIPAVDVEGSNDG